MSDKEVKSPGYDDTPVLQDSAYRVHDCTRPQPHIVAPGTESTQGTPGAAPSDAVVLFDGTDLANWEARGGEGDAQWKVENGYVEVVPGTGSIQTREHFGNAQFHIEWATPEVVKGDSQGRGNSGVFLMGLYEIQVLDSYDNPTYADGTAGSIYGQRPPLVNPCRKPGEWQDYDIIWIGPKFDGETLVSPARVTVFLNGVLLHHDKTLLGPTEHKILATYRPHPPVGPLELQDHGDLVRFRNIWCRPLTEYDAG